MSVNSRLKATKIKGQRKEFYRQTIPEPCCKRKETIAIDILVTSRNSDKKIMQSIRITSRPPLRMKKWNQLSQFRWTSTKSNTYTKNLSWLHLHNEPRVQERLQVKDQQSCISTLQLIKQVQVATRSTIPDMTTLFHTWKYALFI